MFITKLKSVVKKPFRFLSKAVTERILAPIQLKRQFEESQWSHRRSMNFQDWLDWRAHLKSRETVIHPRVEFYGKQNPTRSIQIGYHCVVEPDCTFWVSPDFGADPNLQIGDKVFIARNVYLGVYQPITIGSNTMIGAYSYIISANHRYDRRNVPIRDQGFTGAPIVIEDDVWIGTHVVILSGLTIGKGAVIAAGSIVNKSIPPYEVWGGVPAKYIKQRPD